LGKKIRRPKNLSRWSRGFDENRREKEGSLKKVEDIPLKRKTFNQRVTWEKVKGAGKGAAFLKKRDWMQGGEMICIVAEGRKGHAKGGRSLAEKKRKNCEDSTGGEQ